MKQRDLSSLSLLCYFTVVKVDDFQQEQVLCSPALEEAQLLRSVGAVPNMQRFNSAPVHPPCCLL